MLKKYPEIVELMRPPGKYLDIILTVTLVTINLAIGFSIKVNI